MLLYRNSPISDSEGVKTLAYNPADAVLVKNLMERLRINQTQISQEYNVKISNLSCWLRGEGAHRPAMLSAGQAAMQWYEANKDNTRDSSVRMDPATEEGARADPARVGAGPNNKRGGSSVEAENGRGEAGPFPKRRKKELDKGNKPKGRVSPYFLFQNMIRAEKNMQGLGNAEIVAEASRRWSAMGSAEKQPFIVASQKGERHM